MARCPDCQYENPAHARFCLECGTSIGVRCSQCGAELPGSAKFCLGCGARLATSPRAEPEDDARATIVDGERRHLTVLFCDLADSTAWASRLGAERSRDVVRGFQAMAAEVVERFDGYVAQYLGDGLLVYFGYPRAHEDAPERAVRCGLDLIAAMPRLNDELQSAHGVALALRAGIHTGPVVVSEMGGGPRRETLALGDIPNLAARLQSHAEHDTLVISAATLRLVPGVFVTRDLGSWPVKGFDDPIPMHRVLRRAGMRSRLLASGERRPPVGRQAELGLLWERWSRACEGRGHVVAISGEPGIGKSCLVQGFRERLANTPHTWLECRGSPYTRDSALFPVLELHQRILGLGADVGAGEKFARIETGLAASGFDPVETAPILAALHGIDLPVGFEAPALSPTGLRKRTLALLSDWLLQLGQQQPAVLLLEDLQWMDPSTLELLSLIVEEMARSRVLLLLTHRADFEPTWLAHTHVTPLPLHALGSAATAELIRAASQQSELPGAWIEEIARRSDGVPLFAEELTRAVIDSNSGAPDRDKQLQVPESLEDLLMERLDRLGTAKQAAQVGSVIGREFSYPLVRALWQAGEPSLRAALAEAVRQECFFQRGAPPDARYAFKHALICDAAYQSLLSGTRRRCHERVARALLSESPEVALDQPELLAHHWTEAGETEQAIGGWQRAGDLAVSRAANREAIHHLMRGLSLIASLPAGTRRDARELSAQLSLGHALVGARGWGHPDTRAAWERAHALCDPGLDALRSGTIACGLADSCATAGDLERAQRHFDEAGAIGEQSGNGLLAVARHQGLAMVQHYQGRYGEALRNVEAALALYDPKRHHFLESGFYEEKGVNLLSWAAWICWHVGRVDRAWAMAARAMREARERRDPFALAFALAWSSITALLRRDWPEANRLGRESAKLASEQSFPMLEALGAMAEIFSEGIVSGDPDCVQRFTGPLLRAAETGNRLGTPMILAFYAELQLRVEQIEPALATLDQALVSARESGQHCYDARLLELRAAALAEAGGDDAELETALRSALETATEQSARSFGLRAATRLAGFLAERDRGAEAATLLAPLVRDFGEGLDMPDLRDARSRLAALGSAG
jgi:class 3 adenylate cyclase/tetratricopeptide (TPR) repeat protein